MSIPPGERRELRSVVRQQFKVLRTEVMWSNAAGAVLDTFVFLALAGFPVTSSTVIGQLVGKVVWATALPVLVVFIIRKVRRGAVSRDAVGA